MRYTNLLIYFNSNSKSQPRFFFFLVYPTEKIHLSDTESRHVTFLCWFLFRNSSPFLSSQPSNSSPCLSSQPSIFLGSFSISLTWMRHSLSSIFPLSVFPKLQNIHPHKYEILKQFCDAREEGCEELRTEVLACVFKQALPWAGATEDSADSWPGGPSGNEK